MPCLILSPYSRGGLVASDVFDHTSQPKFLGPRFGVPVPNLSDWRRDATGDLTAVFDFARPATDALPALPGAGVHLEALLERSIDILRATLDHGKPSVVPSNTPPEQEKFPMRGRPSGVRK